MPLSLKEAQAVADLAEAFYSFLPSTPHPYGNKHLSLPAIAADRSRKTVGCRTVRAPYAVYRRRIVAEQRLVEDDVYLPCSERVKLTGFCSG